MNKTLKKVLSGVISASMLCSALAIPHTALADDALPTDGLLMDITFCSLYLSPYVCFFTILLYQKKLAV